MRKRLIDSRKQKAKMVNTTVPMANMSRAVSPPGTPVKFSAKDMLTTRKYTQPMMAAASR